MNDTHVLTDGESIWSFERISQTQTKVTLPGGKVVAMNREQAVAHWKMLRRKQFCTPDELAEAEPEPPMVELADDEDVAACKGCDELVNAEQKAELESIIF